MFETLETGSVGVTLPASLTFNNPAGEIVGRLYVADGRLHFEGDADESARRLLQLFTAPGADENAGAAS